MTAIVPSIWPLEVVNVLLVAERRKRLKQVDSLRFIALLSQLPIVVDNQQPEKEMQDLLALGRSFNLSSYDAAYLDLAIKNGCPIATKDQKLVQAAEQASVSILRI
jgi:predicted nucleic acid-binding protein